MFFFYTNSEFIILILKIDQINQDDEQETDFNRKSAIDKNFFKKKLSLSLSHKVVSNDHFAHNDSATRLSSASTSVSTNDLVDGVEQQEEDAKGRVIISNL